VIADQGPGLPGAMAALLDQAGPAPTSLPESKGLGIWTTSQLIRRLGGRAGVEYPGLGTRVIVNLPIKSGETLNVAA
jgi:sensor histidine kinase regulating citrate/malate metabolism